MRHPFLAVLFALLPLGRLQAQPKVEFDQTKRDMGTLLWQKPQTAVFNLVNKSTETLLVREVRTDCGCTRPEWTATPIEPGGRGAVRVTYNAELLGHFTKNVLVYTNLSEKPFTLALSGEVALKERDSAGKDFPCKVGNFALSTDEVEFDDVRKGDTPECAFLIYNAGRKSYYPELMHLPKYLTARAEPAVIRPGATGKVILTLNSHELNNLGLTQTSVYLSRFVGDRVGKENEIGVSVVLLPETPETPDADSPQLLTDSTTVAVAPAGRKGAAGQLLISNGGERPLVISMLQVYHPGISVSLSKREIRKGETAKLKIKLNEASIKRGKNRKILLITNDPRRPKTIINVSLD